MSGSSYWPRSAVYVHGIAPLSRIQATATEVSRPPEKAMPTRSPLGREVRTLLTSRTFRRSFGGAVSARRSLRSPFDHLVAVRTWLTECSAGQAHESSYDVLAAGRVARDHQDGVVAGDGAEHVAELGLVQRRGQEVGGPGGRAEHHEVGAGVGGDQQLLAEPRQP